MVFLVLLLVLLFHPIDSFLGKNLSPLNSYVARRPALNDYKLFSSPSYDSQSITVLEGLDAVRKRPGMYIGSTGNKGLNHLVYEILDNSVDESLAGHCNSINVTVFQNGGVLVEDNGRGIPCSVHSSTGKSALETVLCILHAGGKFGGENSGYRVSGGLHGVGLSVVNALSASMHVTVLRDGMNHTMSLSRGKVVKPLISTDLVDSSLHGTSIYFVPDSDIFHNNTSVDVKVIADRMEELSFLHPKLQLQLQTHFGNHSDEVQIQNFHHEGGLVDFINSVCESCESLHVAEGPLSFRPAARSDVAVDVCFQWSKNRFDDRMIGFVNGIRTIEGGSHVEGVKSALIKSLISAAKKHPALKSKEEYFSIPAEYFREGLTAIISTQVANPEFEGQTKTKLGNPEVKSIVESLLQAEMEPYFDWHPQLVLDVFNRALTAQAASLAAREARNMVRKKSSLLSTILPGKLADCSNRQRNESEIFIVEGDSAAGSAKQGRDRRNQAVLPLRGKILNIERAISSKIHKNTELQALIAAIGLNSKGPTNGEYNEDSLRYDKVILMTDADVDGSHIRTLLLTFFYRYQKELLVNGHIYIACPPLYKISKGKHEEYLYDGGELKTRQKQWGDSQQWNIQRFKGLGEMMPNQLWDTTMNPSTRKLKQVQIVDGEKADFLFSKIMGEDVAYRKELIREYSLQTQLEELDI